MPERPIILWLRRDLRLEDHNPLAAAAASGAPIILCYIHDTTPPSDPASRLAGGAGNWWLHHSLKALNSAVAERDGRLILRHGPLAATLLELVQQTQAQAVFCSRHYEPQETALEAALHRALTRQGVDFRRFPGYLLFEPEKIHTDAGSAYKVFTPFWRACRQQETPRLPRPAPEQINFFQPWPDSDRLGDWDLLPRQPDWAGGLRETWNPGAAAARATLQSFLDHQLVSYPAERDYPAIAGTSRLSPHLHFGELSARQLWHLTYQAAARQGHLDQAEAFLRELGWREFCQHLLFHFPSLPYESLRPEFRQFPWQGNRDQLKAWQQGRTGYPIVDAGMRELWHSGWMHNRVRMIVASFLIKDLLLPWQLGEAWFWDTLVDANLASNTANWQWVAGCGTDAAPYFRIFNPVTQGRKFDPQGHYVRRWIPELQQLPDRYLHCPWQASHEVLAEAGVELGITYPPPLVDHELARKAALEAFRNLG